MERGEQGWWRGESKAGGEGRARLVERESKAGGEGRARLVERGE